MARNVPPEILAVGGLAVAGALVYFRRPIEGAVRDVFARGERLTYAATDGLTGEVLEAPETLARLASNASGMNVPVAVNSLARMIRSEGATEGLLRAHVALNDAAALGWDLQRLLTYSTASWARGRYGKQHVTVYRTPAGGETTDKARALTSADGKPVVVRSQTRRYSTARDPYMGDVRTAMAAIAERGRGLDRAQGAVKFVDKSAMGGVQAGTGSFAALVERWGRDGLSPFTLPEYGDDLVLFRRA